MLFRSPIREHRQNQWQRLGRLHVAQTRQDHADKEDDLHLQGPRHRSLRRRRCLCCRNDLLNQIFFGHIREIQCLRGDDLQARRTSKRAHGSRDSQRVPFLRETQRGIRIRSTSVSGFSSLTSMSPPCLLMTILESGRSAVSYAFSDEMNG